MPASAEAQIHDPYAALRYSDYRYFLAGRLAASMGSQMIDVAIGWELYERTNRALALGFVGLVQVVPIILLALPAGHAADDGFLHLCFHVQFQRGERVRVIGE